MTAVLEHTEVPVVEATVTDAAPTETAAVEKNTLRVLDRNGDTAIAWDPAVTAEVDVARKSFKKMKDQGYLAYRVDASGAQGEVLRDFDPAASSIIMSPQMQGG